MNFVVVVVVVVVVYSLALVFREYLSFFAL